MISEIENPNSINYTNLKQTITSSYFPWHWVDSSTTELHDSTMYESFGYYSHCFLGAPGGADQKILYSHPNSNFLGQVHDVIVEILNCNNIYPQVIFRLQANCVHPTKNGKPSVPHRDHTFPHKNILIYLTDTYCGDTIVEGKKYSGKENSSIVFEGEHYHLPPNEGRRVVLVGTFL